jgi:hypothetical protein
MCTVGYGDVSASTQSEKAFSIVAMATGGIFYGYMLGNIGSLVNARNQNDRRCGFLSCGAFLGLCYFAFAFPSVLVGGVFIRCLE